MELVCAFLVGLVMLSMVVTWVAIDDAARVNSKLREESSRADSLKRSLESAELTISALSESCETFQGERDEWKQSYEELQSQCDADGGQVRELRGRILTARAALED